MQVIKKSERVSSQVQFYDPNSGKESIFFPILQLHHLHVFWQSSSWCKWFDRSNSAQVWLKLNHFNHFFILISELLLFPFDPPFLIFF